MTTKTAQPTAGALRAAEQIISGHVNEYTDREVAFAASVIDRETGDADLLEALEAAVELIHIWHDDVAWKIYLENAPEMQPIRAALARARGEK